MTIASTSGAPSADPTATPLSFGVGARVTASVMTDDYARVLVDILSRLDLTGLVRETGDVSTYLGGHETHLQRVLIDLAEALARTEHHATLSLTLSRGCPGEPDDPICEVPEMTGPLAPLEERKAQALAAVSEAGFADQAAAAADLVRDKDSAVPGAILSGLGRFVTDDDGPGSKAQQRPADQDLFR